ncbi:MAG TPA: patatin-like phospholipase family protein [Candidatus Melainabacteria bacterium]|nr:patatin-like phospholipase family protein [Candidatus Melainabacteria bacterium]HIN64674.1 patatin-like phospholipase family protein [Candidatus Obscuribacterales bacterium]
MKRSLVALSCLLVSLFGMNAAFADEPNHPPKLGIALGGGGTRGAAHIGVLRVLEQEGIKPDIIVGNSMGSIVGSLYCAGVPLDKIEELVVDGRLRKAYAPLPVPIQLIKKAGGKLLVFRKKRQPGFYDGQGLADFINENVPEDKRKIENLSPTFAAVVTNLLDGQAYRLTKGDLGQAVRASATLPPILRAVEIDGNLYADGGIRSNMPTYPARAMGSDVLIAVDVNEPLKKLKAKDLMNFGKTSNRMSSIVLACADELHLRIADFIINPKVTGISLLSKKKEDFKLAIAEGEKAAREMVPAIKSKLASMGMTQQTVSQSNSQVE